MKKIKKYKKHAKILLSIFPSFRVRKIEIKTGEVVVRKTFTPINGKKVKRYQFFVFTKNKNENTDII